MDDIDRPARRGARRRGSQHISRRTLAALAVASCFSASTALANPTGAQIVNGQASIIQNGALLQITNTPNAIINWQSFSIGASEITKFIQQSQASAVLNRVIGNGSAIDPSVILGALQSNGRVFLVNPSGIVFGAGSQVDVAGLVATSLNLSNSDFLAGKLKFTDGATAGSVVNQGNITAGTGGEVYLVGNAVTNNGIIKSPNGDVVLAAGNSVELVSPGTPNLRVEITAPDNAAKNLGQIVVDSGRAGIYAGLVNNSGTIRADSVVSEGGKILLKATKSATLEAGSVTTANGANGGSVTVQSGDTTMLLGSIEARGLGSPPAGGGVAQSAGVVGVGGTVKVLGNLVGLTGNASINASGNTGGGSVLVGGDFHGANPDVQNAFRTYVGANTNILADAINSGDGGKVVVWSDDATRAYGAITARGGAQDGNGGFVEISGRKYLDFHAKVDVTAAAGKGGTLLLDPDTITIAGGTGDGAATPDGSGTFQGSTTPGTVLFADADITSAGVSNVFQSELEGLPAGTNIVLEATNYISTSGTFTGGRVALPNNSNLTMRTRNASTDGTGTIGINLTTSTDATNLEFKTQGTGGIILQTGVGASPQSADITLGKLTTAGGSITINGTGNVSLGGISIGATGNLDIQSSGSITQGGSGALVVTGTSRFVSTGSGSNGRINLNLGGNSFGGQVTLAGTELQIGSSTGNIDLAPISNAESLFAGANAGEVRLSGGYTVVDNGNFSPDMDFSGALIRLQGDTSLTAKGSIQFNAQVLGPHQLTLDNTGPRQASLFLLTLGDTVGSGNALTGLTVRSDNAVSLAGTNVGGNLDIQSSGSITQGGSGALVVTGTSRFVSTGSGSNGRINLNLGGNSFGGQVTLAGTELQIGSSTGNIDLAPISNAESLFAGANAGEVRLSGGYTVVDNGNFSPDMDFSGALIRLQGDTSLTAKGSIQFNAQVLGPHQLTLDNTGPRQASLFLLTLGDTVGSGNALTGLTVRSDNAVSLAGTNVGGNLDIQSSGSITQGGSGALVVTGTSRFVSTGSGSNGRINLNLGGNSFGGQVTLAGTELQIGSSTGNIDLAPISNAESLFAGANAGEVRLSGGYTVVDNGNFSPDMDFSGALIRLQGDTSLTAKGSIQFNAQVLGPHQLTLDNTGPRQASLFLLTLGDTVGSGNALTGLTVRSDNAVSLAGTNVGGNLDIQSSGSITQGGSGALVVTGTSRFVSTGSGSNGRINLNLGGNSFGGQVTLAGTELQIGSSTGNIDLAPISNAESLFAGANAGEVRLSGGYTVVDNGNFSPDMDFSGALIRLQGDTSLTAKGSIQFNAQVLGPHQLTLDNTGPRQASLFLLTLGDTVGSGNALTGLTVRSDNAVSLPITNVNGAVDVVANNGDVTLRGVVTATGAGDALVVAAPAGNFINNVGAAALAALNGRWLVYSTSPAGSTENGLTGVAGSIMPRLYNRTFAANGPATITQPGNHLIYSFRPTLNVTASPASRAYGAADPAFTYTASGFFADPEFTDTLAGAGFAGALATTAVANSPVPGPYPITQGTLVSSAGYAINYTAGNLTIGVAPLTIAADNKTKFLNDPNPPFTATFAGLAPGDGPGSLAGTLRFATTAATDSPLGNYPITPSGLSSTNYTITFVDGVLQVRPLQPPENTSLLAAMDRSFDNDNFLRDRDVLERRLQDEARERNSCR